MDQNQDDITDKNCVIPLSEMPRGVKFIRQGVERKLPSGVAGENGELCVMSRVSVLQDENTSGDRLHNHVNVLITAEWDA